MAIATFFLSTGRCGTQWLTRELRRQLGTHARIEHEPLHDAYQARRMRGVGKPTDLSADHAERIDSHCRWIDSVLEQRDYIETGFPCWSTLPHFANRFAGRIRIVHLTRHPVPTALSLLSNGAYQPPLLPHEPDRTLLHPADPGVTHTRFAPAWASLSRYERCLFYWTEVHTFAIELLASRDLPWLRIKFEDLVTPEGRDRLAAFLPAAADAPGGNWESDVEDRFRFPVVDWPDPNLINNHPTTCSLARRLGYDPLDFDADQLRRRHHSFGLTGC